MPAELRDRIGQMILVGFRGITPIEAQPTIRNIAAGFVGSVVLYDVDAETGGSRNIASREQLRDLIVALKSASEIPVMVSVDAEGGLYHRLKQKYGFWPVVTAAEMGEQGDPAYTRIAARNIARQLTDVGIDMNLAPVLDLLNPVGLKVGAYRRRFSADPVQVVTHAREFILAHREEGVLTAIKHFPGMYDALRPYSPGVGELIENWNAAELEPYRALIGEGIVDAVLTAGVTHPVLDPDYPCLLSRKIVSDLLRKEIGFDGVVVSNTMEMLAVWDVFGFERGTILAVNAGVDILLFANESATVAYSDDRAPAAVHVILDAIARGEISEQRINESCARILALKSRLGAVPFARSGVGLLPDLGNLRVE
jgi:beta-N-acetylhexosaminidase